MTSTRHSVNAVSHVQGAGRGRPRRISAGVGSAGKESSVGVSVRPKPVARPMTTASTAVSTAAKRLTFGRLAIVGIMRKRHSAPRAPAAMVMAALSTTIVPYPESMLSQLPIRTTLLAIPVRATIQMDNNAIDEYRRIVASRSAPATIATIAATNPPVQSETKTMCRTSALTAIP